MCKCKPAHAFHDPVLVEGAAVSHRLRTQLDAAAASLCQHENLYLGLLTLTLTLADSHNAAGAQLVHNYLQQDQLFHRAMHLPVALAAMSDAVATVLDSQFGRSAVLLPNGVDGARFAPGPRSERAPDAIIQPDPGLVQVRHRCGFHWHIKEMVCNIYTSCFKHTTQPCNSYFAAVQPLRRLMLLLFTYARAITTWKL